MKRLFNLGTIVISAMIFLCGQYSMRAQNMVQDSGQEGLRKSVTYNVASFTDIRDKKLEDVMVKMPGLSKGLIGYSYNGKTIMKFYINGLDVLQGDYTSVYNLKPEEVKSLVIEENHVAINVLRGVQYSDDVSVDVILDDSVRGKWSGSLKAMAGGSPAIGTFDLNGMQIGHASKTSFSVKADNTGLSLGGLSTNFSARSSAFSMYTSVLEVADSDILGDFSTLVTKFLNSTPSLAPLSQERVRFNHSTSSNVAKTFKINNDYQMSLSVTYRTDRQTASSFQEKTYYQDGNSTAITDITGKSSEQQSNTLSVSSVLLSNTDRKYLKNTLLFTGEWTDMTQNVYGTIPNYNDVGSEPISISDNLSYKRLINNNVLNVAVKFGLNTRPQDLLVRKEEGDFSQTIRANSSFLNAGARYDVKLSDRFTMALNAGAAGNFRGITTDMFSTASVMPDNLDAIINIANAFGGAKFTYITDNMQAELRLPLVYADYLQKDKTKDITTNSSKFYFSPRFIFKSELSRQISLSWDTAIDEDEVSRTSIYPGMIFKDFRNASMGYPEIMANNSTTSTLNASYKNPVHSFFVNGSVMGKWKKDAFVSHMQFQDDFIISGYHQAPAGYKGTTLKGLVDVNKGIKTLKGKVGLKMSLSRSENSMVRGYSVVDYTHESWGLAPYVNGRLTSWLNTIYKLEYYQSHMFTEGMNSSSNSREYFESTEMIISPWTRMNFSILGEHYYTEFSADDSKHLSLLDFKAEYRINDKLQCLLTATNILNQKTYHYTLVDSTDLSRSLSSYTIRPRNVLLGVFYKF